MSVLDRHVEARVVDVHHVGARTDPVFHAFWLLHVAFATAPILLGIDKLTHVVTDWDRLLAPEWVDLLGAEAHTLMYLVGVVEVVAGLVVLLRPRVGGYVLAAWLAGVIVNLLLMAAVFDAVRDFGLLLAALALARLATAFPQRT